MKIYYQLFRLEQINRPIYSLPYLTVLPMVIINSFASSYRSALIHETWMGDSIWLKLKEDVFLKSPKLSGLSIIVI